MDSKGYIPDWENSYNWEEFEWEEALKYSDHIASRYFRMLERFGDLPNADELIAAKLGEQNFFLTEDDDYDELIDGDADDFSDFKESEERTEPNLGIEPGDSLYFECSPLYKRIRQITLGWSNIFSTVLKPEDRYWGLKILFFHGRVLSYISLAVGDGTFEHINGNIIFTKRSLHQINVIIGEIRSKSQESPHYNSMLSLINFRLLEIHDLLITYLFDCKRRKKDNKIF